MSSLVAFRGSLSKGTAHWIGKVSDQRNRRTLCAKEVDRS